MNEFKSKKNPLVWLSLFPLFQPKDFPQFETSVSTCIFAMFILNGFEHSCRLFEACHRSHQCHYHIFESNIDFMKKNPKASHKSVLLSTLCCNCICCFACFYCKMRMFWRAGMREGGREATPTSISIFDSYDMKTL